MAEDRFGLDHCTLPIERLRFVTKLSNVAVGRYQGDRGHSSRMIGGPSGRKQRLGLSRAQTTRILEDKMCHGERMSAVDTTRLRMDRPQSLMLIVAVWMLEGTDWYRCHSDGRA